MSNLFDAATEALGLAPPSSSVNPLEVIGLSWQITLSGLSDDDLYDIVRSFVQKRVAKIHPDLTKRKETDADRRIRDAFESLKNREVFDKHLKEFKQLRSEDSYYSKILKERSKNLERAKNRISNELESEKVIREDAKNEADFYKERLLTFIKMQSLLNRPKDPHSEIVFGRSRQVNVSSINGIQQLVVCKINAQFVDAPSSEVIGKYKGEIQPKVIKITKRIQKIKEILRRIENKYFRNAAQRIKHHARTKPAMVKGKMTSRLKMLTERLEVFTNFIINNNIGLPTLSEAIEESIIINEEINSQSVVLPLIRFSYSDMFDRLGIHGVEFHPKPPTFNMNEARLKDKIKKIQASTESLDQLTDSYLGALAFYKRQHEGRVVKNLVIYPHVIPLEEGAIQKTYSTTVKNTKVIGSIPLDKMGAVEYQLLNDGTIHISNNSLLTHMIPCVVKDGLLISVRADYGGGGIKSLVKKPAAEFYNYISSSKAINFSCEEIVLAIYS